uniref:MRG domain binding protein n=3 Tax=Yangochiroptera TaxID=30560 RepID=A0A7J8HIJ9_MOLMO|nr:MRG domain binding protein [Molossus molossus]
MGEAEVGGGGAAGDKGPGEAATSPAEETVVWSPEVEVCLFHAMLGHKPVGVNRHFHMICIRDKFSQNIGRQVPSKVIWDHLSTMYDMQALHESEILPFPNPERNFVLPEEIIQEVREGKVIIEEEMKEEMKEDMDPHNGADDVFSSSGSLGKATEKSSKDRDKNSSDLGAKEGADKRKRSRVTDKVLTANSNPSSPSAAKRRRTCRVGTWERARPWDMLGEPTRQSWTSCWTSACDWDCAVHSRVRRWGGGRPSASHRADLLTHKDTGFLSIWEPPGTARTPCWGPPSVRSEAGLHQTSHVGALTLLAPHFPSRPTVLGAASVLGSADPEQRASASTLR